MTLNSSSMQKTLLAAATLATGATIDRWSRMAALATIIALIVLPAAPVGATTALWLSLLAGMAQMYKAMRTTLDEKIIAGWSARWAQNDADVAGDLAAFDAALHDLFGKTPAPRDLDVRIASAVRLLKTQAAALGAQLFLLVLALALRYLPG